jgi:hypothetical protein
MAKGVVAVSSVWLGRPILHHSLRGLHSASSYVRSVMDRHLLDDPDGVRGDVVSAVIPNSTNRMNGSSGSAVSAMGSAVESGSSEDEVQVLFPDGSHSLGIENHRVDGRPAVCGSAAP